MFVKNMNGTSELECECGTWLKHWERFSKKSAVLCQTIACVKVAEVGAHVIKAEGADKKRYIVPLCKACNARADEFNVTESALVPANVQKTCGK